MGSYKKAYIKRADSTVSKHTLQKNHNYQVCFSNFWKSTGKFFSYFLIAYSIPGSWILLIKKQSTRFPRMISLFSSDQNHFDQELLR